MVLDAPPAAHLPLCLFGAVHYELLSGLEHPLAEVYAGRSDADPVPLFRDVCRLRHDALVEVMAARPVQTNDCGRSALIGPALTWIADQDLGPLALVDVGASAGLNLMCDRYRLDYGDRGVTGPADSSVTIRCRVVAGDPPVVAELPPLVARVGIDRAPLDVSDADDARWLLACVWPDTGRFPRVEASVRLAQADPPVVRAGDAADLLPSVLDDLPPGVAPVITTTWVVSYFDRDQRNRFVGQLAAASADRPVAWLGADDAAVFGDTLPPSRGAGAGPGDNVLRVEVFADRERQSTLLARVHPHGHWIEWWAP